MEWFFFGLLIAFCLMSVLPGFIPRIKTPMEEGVAVLVYKTAEDHIWVGEYIRNGEVCIALISCHKKHRAGDEVEIKPENHTTIPVFMEV